MAGAHTSRKYMTFYGDARFFPSVPCPRTNYVVIQSSTIWKFIGHSNGYHAEKEGVRRLQHWNSFRNSKREQRAILAGSAPIKYGPGGGKKNLQVEPDRPGLAVTQIQPDHFVEPGPVSPTHLPQAGDAWSNFQDSPTVPDIVNFELVRNWRARADE